MICHAIDIKCECETCHSFAPIAPPLIADKQTTSANRSVFSPLLLCRVMAIVATNCIKSSALNATSMHQLNDG